MKKKLIFFLTLVLIIIIIGLIDIPNFRADENNVSKMKNVNLPKMHLTGDVGNLSTKTEETIAFLQYESSSINFNAYAKVKIQGSSSAGYEKKNYNIKLYEDERLDNKLKVDLGWGEQNKYCLKANWVDKTHSRNIVTANIVADIQKQYNLFTNSPNYGEIDGYPIEVYLNEEFLGLYTVNIPKGDWMFNMDEDNKNNLVFSANGWTAATQFRSEGDFSDWNIEVGQESNYSLDKLNRILSFVINSNDDEFKQNLNNYFDLDSLLNYYVMMQFANLVDNSGNNTLLVTYDGDIWYTSLYDLDTSWGTTWNGYATLDYNLSIDVEHNILFKKLVKCYPNEIADRYFELRKDFFTKDYVMSKFNDFVNSIPDDIYQKEKDRWNLIPGYDIKQISDYIDVRIPMLDEMFGNMYTKRSIVSVIYTKNDSGTVTANLVSEHNNIKCINACTYEFDKDGEYTFYFDDYLGNINSITAKVIGINYEL